MNKIENTIKNIGNRIKYYRQLNKISLSKLANQANISKSTLFGLEEGKSNPTISTLINIADTLNIDLNEFLGNTSNNSKSNKLIPVATSANNNYNIYKLALSPYEFFSLKDYSSVEIEVLEGDVALIEQNLVLSKGDKIKSNNTTFKAYNSSVTILIKILKESEEYIKNDIFKNKITDIEYEKLTKNAINSLISRVIIGSIYPLKEVDSSRYISSIEISNNKESHYYFFRRYLGLVSSINNTLELLGVEDNSIQNRVKQLIELSNMKGEIKKSDYDLLNSSPTQYIKDKIKSLISKKYPNIKIIESISGLDELISGKDEIVLIDDLTKVCSSSLSLTVQLYRVFESLYILDESILSSNELSLYNTIKNRLPKALYFAYSGYCDISIKVLKSYINQSSKFTKDSSETNLFKSYLKIIDAIKEIVENYSNNLVLNSCEVVEFTLRDMGYKIELKELISPVFNSCGLYLYKLKRSD